MTTEVSSAQKARTYLLEEPHREAYVVQFFAYEQMGQAVFPDINAHLGWSSEELHILHAIEALVGPMSFMERSRIINRVKLDAKTVASASLPTHAD